jgi:hypothetical protein
MSDDRRQKAWRLHVQEGMPIRAVAQTLSVPVGTVKAWIHRDKRRGVQHATDDVSATDTDTATGATATGVEPTTASDIGLATGTPATDTSNAIETGTATQDVLVPPPPDALGRPYISLIGTFDRWVPCPACRQPWPRPRWDSSDSMRRLVVVDMGGTGAPQERLVLKLICKTCTDAGPKGSQRYVQVVPTRHAGDCRDCTPRDLGPDEYVRCIDGRTRCLKHAERWWRYAGQIEHPDRPCLGCGTTESLYVSDDGQVRCKACRLRAWRRDREGTDAPGRGLPLGL